MFSFSLICRQVVRPSLNFSYGAAVIHRPLSTHKINDNLYLCTDKPRNIEIDKNSLKFKQVKENTKPLVLMISWFYGQKSTLNKYSKLYTDQGLDVLVGRLSLVQFIFSVKGTERFAQNIADVLQNNEDDYKEIYIHSFSAGCGMLGIVQRMIKRNLDKYGNIPKRVVGQVWDSPGPPSKVIIAVPLALYPNNMFMQSAVRTFLRILFNLHKRLEIHYADGVYNMYHNLVKAPALIFTSKTDSIGTVVFANEILDTWKSNGVDVTVKIFEDTEHVKHFQKHPEVYLKYLHEHWERVKLLERR